ncbi:MAG: glycerate kinase [Halomonas sp.]|uniref:glycerate kinase n=1 Tax=Halomonas sp. TaxID=1486246 RepID=UPI00184EB1FF|nr:glycerate kinase [Halomonas sp.]NWN81667.1 glycerate kinase [Halomonas sp.]
MHIILAPDSYKDALSAREAADAMTAGIRRVSPSARCETCPMGDGGEGTLDALIVATGAERRFQRVRNALGRPCQAEWGWNAATRTAYIELAQACGIQQLTHHERTALHSSTYGVGELIIAALDAGAERLILMLGGSATNDAGAGMLQALGTQLLNAHGEPLPPGGASLIDLKQIVMDHLNPRLATVIVEAAVDVDNPLLGERGASAVFGPQKGASEADVARLDYALRHFADKVTDTQDIDCRGQPGAGAAGGMGFAASAFLGATMKPGIELAISQVHFRERLINADLVITGEGRLDGQSMSGKTPIGIARCARDSGVPVVVLTGSLGEGWQLAYQEGVTSVFALADGPLGLDEALVRCAELLSDRTESVVRLFQANVINKNHSGAR